MDTPGAKFAESPCRMCGTHQAIVTGAWCRAQRQAAGLTVKALAVRSGFAPATLHDVEYGRLRCTPRIRAAYEALEPKPTGDGERKEAA